MYWSTQGNYCPLFVLCPTSPVKGFAQLRFLPNNKSIKYTYDGQITTLMIKVSISDKPIGPQTFQNIIKLV